MNTVHHPTGYRDFGTRPDFNYTLNRWLSVLPERELEALAPQLRDRRDWTRLMLEHGNRAEAEGRHLEAAFFLRAAEFYMDQNSPDKMRCYERFIALFQERLRELPHTRHSVPYESAELPVLVLPPANGTSSRAPRDVVLLHGGFDSFMEELVDWGLVLTQAGYEVVLFEGPGQGAPLRRHGLTMPADWERPVGAVLDHLDIEACTIFGISLGGYLAPRAAAFEPRIERVVVCDVLDNFFDCFASRSSPRVAHILDRLSRWGARRTLNRLFRRAVHRNPEMEWALGHGLSVSGARDAFEFVLWLKKLDTAPFSSRITQDFLLLAGRNDHIVPLHQLFRQAENLTAVRSLTARIYGEAESADAHCQIGNVGLMLDEVVRWLDARTERSRSTAARGLSVENESAVNEGDPIAH